MRLSWFLYLRGEASVADGALERPLFGVAAIVDLEGGMAGERLVANVARRVPSHCKRRTVAVTTTALIGHHNVGFVIKSRNGRRFPRRCISRAPVRKTTAIAIIAALPAILTRNYSNEINIGCVCVLNGVLRKQWRVAIVAIARTHVRFRNCSM